MFKARLSYPDARSFHSMLDALAKIVDEAAMTIKPEGVEAIALDPAKVALIRINLPAETFIEYDVREEVKLGFNVPNTVKIIGRGKKGDKLDIEIGDEYVQWYIIGSTIKRYKLLNLDIPVPEIPEANFQFKIHVSMIVDPFKNALRDAEAVGDTLELETPDENTLIIRGIGASTSETRIQSDSPAIVDFKVEEPGKAAYSIEYLKHILSLTKVADTITIEYSNDMPLRLRFQLPAGGTIEYLLAPKI
ncbi:MAG: DNA polymerase sliding clamp, partial [Hyperthermus sp.]